MCGQPTCAWVLACLRFLGSTGLPVQHRKSLACHCSAPRSPPGQLSSPVRLQSSPSPLSLEVPLFPFLQAWPPDETYLQPVCFSEKQERLFPGDSPSPLILFPCASVFGQVPASQRGQASRASLTTGWQVPPGRLCPGKVLSPPSPAPSSAGGERGPWGRVLDSRSSLRGENSATTEKWHLGGTAALRSPHKPPPATRPPGVQNLQGKENCDVSGLELVLVAESQRQLWPWIEQAPSNAKPGTRVVGATSAETLSLNLACGSSPTPRAG